MAIVAKYNGFDVEVTGTLQTGDGRTKAAVRALVGKPFTVFTHGGPANTDCAVVSPDLLTDVHSDQAPEAQPAHAIRRSRQPGFVRPEWTDMDLEDCAALFPVRQRTPQPGRGGMNQD